ncbi:MAG: sulfatase-like hydrolase/transferase [Tyzzerella sp.]|nr:sulfatase-like hydrolase/transferase [Tyzzerella sp.]
MKKIQISKEDIKQYFQQRKQRRQAILEKQRNSKFAKAMAPIYLWMNRLSLILQFLLAGIINFTIEAISRHSIGEAWEYLTMTPWPFLFNTYMIFVTYLLVYIVKRRVFFRIIISAFWLTIGCVNGYMLSVRVTPFNAQDLKVIDDALSMIDKYFTGPQGTMLIIGILAILAWLVSMWRRGGQYQGKIYRIPAIIVCVIAFATMGKVTDFAIEKRVVSDYFGNIAFAYEDYGLPYCFTASMFNTGIDKPDERKYEEEEILAITENGKLLESSTSRKEMPNIILIQLESFFDSDEAEFFETSQDPIPTFHYLMENYSSGYFKVPSVGAGTANTEFEVLTGMSMRYFGPGEYPYKTYVKKEGHAIESVATALKAFGYGAHALHNNGGNFYSRADVFKNMGFDSYTSEEFMNVLQFTENDWAKDDILTEHILNAMDSTEQQDFVFTITVQGHGDYPEEKVLDNPVIQVTGIEDEGQKNAWEYFVNMLYETDLFIADLISELEQRGEPSVLILYGDHLPTMGLEASDLKSRYLFNTNYVVWDNIGLKEEDQTLATYQLMAEVFKKLDLHSGTVFNYHQTRRQTSGYLSDLELLQYDMLYGDRYVYGGKANAPKVDDHFQMGILDVSLFNMETDPKGHYILYGENMTRHSKVYINGEKQSTSFVNDTRVELKKSKLSEGDTIVVCQVGSSSRIFRSSAEYRYNMGQLVPAENYVEPVDPNVEEGTDAPQGNGTTEGEDATGNTVPTEKTTP